MRCSFFTAFILLTLVSFGQEPTEPYQYRYEGDSIDLDFIPRLYDLDNCYCPWLRRDSINDNQARDMMNYSPYKWDNSKPIKLDSVKDKELIKLLLDKPKFTLPKPEEKKKPTDKVG